MNKKISAVVALAMIVFIVLAVVFANQKTDLQAKYLQLENEAA